MDNTDELNKLEQQISETQILLEKSDNEDTLKKVRFQRNIFALISFLLLASGILLYFFKIKNSATNRLIENQNVLIIDKDSLQIYKQSYFNTLNNPDANSELNKSSLMDEKIIYSVQIGAFKNFYLTSEGLMNLSEFQQDGYNKFSLGNYKTYAEAKVLKDSLIKLGFRDCFLAAKSYGNQIDIREALALSNEPEFLEQ